MRTYAVQAHAKINLFLDVIGKRADGYHDLVSVMQSLELCDDLEFRAHGNGVTFEVEDAPDGFPLDDTNLVMKAAKFLLDKYKIPDGVAVNMKKRIPMGAGLGGGSSDCAATLHGINELFDLKIPLTELMQMGQKFGADVPFCVLGGTALAEGIGEKLAPLPPHPSCHIVLACPEIHVSTAEIFAKLDLNKKNSQHEKFISAYKTKNIKNISSNFYNIFTPITAPIHPQITNLITQLNNLGAVNASMTGTGSAVFGYFENESDAIAACDKIDAKTFVTKPKTVGTL